MWEQGPSRSRPHGKRSCLLRSSDFKEQKGQLVVLQLGKRQLFPADRPLAYKNGILIGPQPPPAHPLAPWLIPQGAAAQNVPLEMLPGSVEPFQGAQRLWPVSHWELLGAEGRDISTLESPKDRQDSLGSPQCRSLGLNAASSEQSRCHRDTFYPGPKYPQRTGCHGLF